MGNSRNKKNRKCDKLLEQARQLAGHGKRAEAENVIGRLLETDANHKDARLMLAQLCFQSGRLPEAAQHLQFIMQQDPDDAQPCFFLAQVLAQAGQPDDALNLYQRTLSLNPDYLEARISAGYLMLTLGRNEEAAEQYEHAIALREDHAPLHYNLAIALAASGKNNEALACYERATELKPDYDAAFFNLGNLQKAAGDYSASIEAYHKAASLAPNQKLYWQALADSFRQLESDDLSRTYDDIVLECLQMSGIDHHGLTRPVKNSVLDLVSQTSSDLPQGSERPAALATAIRQQDLDPLLQLEQLCLLMESTLINDRELELLLTDLRHAFLQVLSEDDLDTEHAASALRFISALARQCYINEFVFYRSPHETDMLESLNDAMTMSTDDLRGALQAPLALYACYENLSADLIDRLPASDDLLPSFARLLETQVSEPAQMAQLMDDLETLPGAVATAVDPVRRQYEDNPYPRWVELPFTIARPPSDVFGQLFPHLLRRGTRFSTTPRILIAGCGTGRHALMSAMRFSGCEVTAVDFSRPSLAYAKQKATHHGIRNISFDQGDILQLNDSQGTFPIIEAVGVLHHLEDPMSGLKCLSERLLPGGFMKIGLYSRIGREPVRAAQSVAQTHGLDSTVEGVREFRHVIFGLDTDDEASRITLFRDFYSVSGCRDLAFHARERWFTLPEIGKMLDELGLEFIGFEFEDQAFLQDYMYEYPSDPDAISLDFWHQYEQQNPETFASMYQFWVMRPR